MQKSSVGFFQTQQLKKMIIVRSNEGYHWSEEMTCFLSPAHSTLLDELAPFFAQSLRDWTRQGIMYLIFSKSLPRVCLHLNKTHRVKNIKCSTRQATESRFWRPRGKHAKKRAYH